MAFCNQRARRISRNLSKHRRSKEIVSERSRRFRPPGADFVTAQIYGLQVKWWAGQDSNLQPDRYERPALTIELPARRSVGGMGLARAVRSRNTVQRSVTKPSARMIGVTQIAAR